MKNVFPTSVILLSLAASALAQNPVDSQVKAALYDIDRAQSQIASVTPKQASKVKRIQGMIENAEAQLAASSNQTDESWIAARSRLDELRAQMNTMLAPAPTHSKDQISGDDVSLVNAIDQQANVLIQELNGSSAADIAHGKDRFLRTIQGLKQQYQRIQQPEHPQAITVAQKIIATEQYIQQQTANELSSPDVSLLGSIDRQTDNFRHMISGYSMFDIARLADQLTGTLNQLKQQVQRVQKPAHPQAVAVAQKISATESYLQEQLDTLAAQEQALGDVEGMVAAIQERLNPSNRSWFGSPVPDAPFDRQTVSVFAQGMNAWKEQLNKDLEYMQSVRGKTTRVNVDNLIQRAQAELHSVDVYNTEMARRIENLLAGHDQIDTYLNKVPVHRVDTEIQKMEYGIELLGIAQMFDEMVGREGVSTQARQARYENAIAVLQDKAATAIADSRFPEIRSENPELLAAAKEVLNRKEYDVNPIRRMGITYDMQRKATKEGEVDWGAVTTTVTITGYEWDEFAVTTVEEVDGNYHLFYNEFKYFHRGGTDVPTGKWTLAKRRQGTQILESNIDG